MRIALVEPAGKGGLIHYAWQLADALAAEGASVTLITDRECELASLDRRFELRNVLRLWDPKPANDGSPTLLRRSRRVLRAGIYYTAWGKILREVRRIRPDVVQLGDIRFATDLVPILLLRKLAPVFGDICHNVEPFSGGEGSTGTFGFSGAGRRAYDRIYRSFDAIFVHYETNVRAFAATFPASAGRVHRIVHGNEEIFRRLADPRVTRADVRERVGAQERAPFCLFFGTLSRYKGLDLLLEAFRDVASEIPDARLVLAGYPFSDFDVNGYLDAAARAGLEGRVVIVPEYIASSEVAAWIDAADVVVFPYRSIFQSGALHVAATMGTPIVATGVGANAELVRHGETGLLTEPGDAAEFGSAMVRLLRDPEFARRLGAAAARDALDRLSWRGVAGTMMKVYDGLLRGVRS